VEPVMVMIYFMEVFLILILFFLPLICVCLLICI
jgi:hypothetical protein